MKNNCCPNCAAFPRESEYGCNGSCTCHTKPVEDLFDAREHAEMEKEACRCGHWESRHSDSCNVGGCDCAAFSLTTKTSEGYKRDQAFFSELEEVLDEYFPKIEEEGEQKKLMKRGDALMLFSAANMIHSRILTKEKEAERGRVVDYMGATLKEKLLEKGRAIDYADRTEYDEAYEMLVRVLEAARQLPD